MYAVILVHGVMCLQEFWRKIIDKMYEVGAITTAFGPSESYIDSLRKAHSAGFQIVQLSWLDRLLQNDFSTSELGEAISYAVPEGVHIHSLCAGTPGENIGEWVQQAKQHIDLAVAMEVGIVSQHIPPIGNPHSKREKPVVEAVRTVADYAAEQGVQYAAETSAQSLGLLAYLKEEISTLGFNFDPGNLLHMRWGPKLLYEEAPRQLGDRIVQVHLKDWDPEKGFDVPLGEGVLNVRRMLEALTPFYDGPLILEDSGHIETRLGRTTQSKQTLEEILN